MSQALTKFKQQMQKSLGASRVLNAEDYPPVEVVSTGSISLDFALGSGGIPRGRVVEIFGRESIGKTSLGYYIMKEHEKKGLATAFVNIEGGSFDPAWAKRLVDLSGETLIVEPDPGTESVEAVARLVESGLFGVVVFDSIGAMLGDKEQEAGEKKQVGGQSGLVTNMIKMVSVPAARNGTTVLFINQIRDAIGSPNTYAIKTPGGHAVQHMAVQRIVMKQAGMSLKNGTEEVGFPVAAKIEKNKTGAPKKVANWNFYFSPSETGVLGIDRDQEIIDLSFNHYIFDHQGGGYYFHPSFPEDKGQHRIRGKDAVAEYIKQTPEVFDIIRKELMDLSIKKIGGFNGSINS